MKTIFILCDTVSRRMLEAYGSSDPALTPNLNRLAHRSVVFDSHWCGSAPCMPARRDILTGRLNFLEKPWGGMEPFDQSMPDILREKNVHTQMFADHAHYLIPGGENYTKGFTAWDVVRGQEGDPVWTRPCEAGIRPDVPPADFKGVWSEAERENRSHFRTEYEYPSVKTMWHAAEWLEENHQADNFMLWVEAFDPHEPYDAPKHYLDLYEKPGEYEGPDWKHPDYQPNIFDEAETDHLRRRCKALLTMTDRHIGEILDVVDEHDMWKDTMVIFTTDHGFHLGEHGYMAKNYMPPYNEVFHIPLMIAAPGIAPGRCGAVTENIDVLPTVMEFFGVSEDVLQYPIHGRSLLPLLRGEAERVRDSAIFGYFGKQVGWTDGRYTYFRAAKDETDRPLYVYTAMPTVLRQFYGANDAVNVADYDKIEMGRFLSWTDYPVYRFPADIIHWGNASQEFSCRSPYNEASLLFDLQQDYAQDHPICDTALEATIVQKLRDSLEIHDAPPEQYERLGL
ncbi:sulfatase [Butyricicoccus sp. Marseille-Q5471]|uniref:sulfatase n=1 Tax=Butyricicoccus sp. Marseille-Q5471 TaxID=3039493 RepID=UPI0024BBFB7D|nr:sulfatase [Butyricicoccus sp. Marseille-Q5471]